MCAVRAFELFGEISLQTGKLQTGLKTATKEFTDLESHVKGKLKSIEEAGSGFGARFGKGLLQSMRIPSEQGRAAIMGGLTGDLR
jgi:hypothetical protein